MTNTDPRTTMREHLDGLLERAGSSDPDEALTGDSVLALDVSGKYINVLFSTGGPHTGVTVEYDYPDEAEMWYDYAPNGAWFTYMDWGVREDLYISSRDAFKIMQAITRSHDDLSDDES